MFTCSAEGCGRDGYAKGLCRLHYFRVMRQGSLDGGPRARVSFEERFWKKVDKRGADDCWHWVGAKMPTGYGYISAGGRDGKNVMAHRSSYEQAKGAIPAGLYVLHSCDRPSCVNPAHLRCGTAKDNTQDAIDRGRLKNPPVMRGEENYKTTLTADQVKIIKVSPHIKAATLARSFGVSHSTVSRVKRGLSWKD